MNSGAPIADPITVPPTSSYPPGDLAVWVFIFAELLAFGVFFLAYAFTRMRHVALFDAMQGTLDRRAGALNTLLLITSSFCVARAVHAVEHATSRTGTRWLAAALACDAGFLIVKGAEYTDKSGAGISLSTNTFYMFYLSLTFFHFMHVILGMVVLAILTAQTRRGDPGRGNMNGLESGAAYWHMVDLVWIVLFPLVYVLR
jgi:nitric oxide reductase NorE protein